MSDNMFITDGLNISAIAMGGEQARMGFIGAANGVNLPSVAMASANAAQVIPNLGSREMGLQ